MCADSEKQLFLTPEIAFMPDPEGTAVLIQALNKVYNLEINTEELSKKAEEIQQKLREISEQQKAIKKSEERGCLPDNANARSVYI